MAAVIATMRGSTSAWRRSERVKASVNVVTGSSAVSSTANSTGPDVPLCPAIEGAGTVAGRNRGRHRGRRAHLEVVEPLDVVVLGRRVASTLLGEQVHDNGPAPFRGVGQGLLHPGDVVPIDRPRVADAQRLEEGVRGDHLAERAGQTVHAGVGEVADGGKLADEVTDALASLDVGRVESKMGEAEGEARHGRRVRTSVVVQHDHHRLARVAQVVEGLVGHAPGQSPVADHGHHPPIEPLELEGTGQPVGIAQDGRGVTVLHPVVLGLGPVGIAGQPSALFQARERVSPSGDQLVHVGLVTGVPQDDVARGVEGSVNCKGELDHPRLEPRWPPVAVTVSTMKARISSDRVASSSGVSVRKSAGLSMCSRIMGGWPFGSGYQRAAEELG